MSEDDQSERWGCCLARLIVGFTIASSVASGLMFLHPILAVLAWFGIMIAAFAI